jgi:glycosyltransferase involved in cell wall biosynthesis
MRILQVTPYFAPAFCYGGPPRSVLGLSRALARAGVGVEVVTTTANGRTELNPSPQSGESENGFVTYRLPLMFPRRFFGATGMGRFLELIVHRFDVLHIHGLWNIPAWLAAQHARRAGIPYVLSPRGMLEPAALRFRASRKRFAYRAIEKRNLRGASLLHATSQQEAATLTRLFPDRRVVVVRNGVDLPEPAPAGTVRVRLAIESTAPLVVFLGRLHPIKRLDLLLNAFAEVRLRHPSAVLALAGPDELGYARTLAPLAAKAGGVRFLGTLDDDWKHSLLADADALVLCSDSENFGGSVAEALAASTPVVVTRTCPWRIIEETGCGLWVEHTADAIATGLLKLLADKPAAREMGRLGRTVAETLLSWDAIAREMIVHYHSLIAREAECPVRP